MINETDGNQFPPHIEKDNKIYVFSTDLCRSLYLEYEKNVFIRGISAYRFTTPTKLFGNPSTNPSNKCFCTDPQSCLHDGTIELSACQQGSPVVASTPHFYQGSSKYREDVIGFKPEKTKHETYLDVEPMTGLVLNGRKGIQLNVYVKQNSYIAGLTNIKDVLMPLAWLSESASLDEEKAEDFRWQVQTPVKIGTGTTLAAVVVGSLWTLLAAGAAIFFST
ncbi:platelet glycoprotein 4-like isoform X2 [Limulus polyphemus]|uniref:Platelet glycoprotein 4-like isoform X2 n=1 Tax=Limulus polyphemus TaxID=6850 RepID=A0ABM1RVS8_LIMPO|nr:platelet glycoprotein 4-like isoform X2 [Limulus polyphemus]